MNGPEIKGDKLKDYIDVSQGGRECRVSSPRSNR